MSTAAGILSGAIISEGIAFCLIVYGLRRRGRSVKDIGSGFGAPNHAYVSGLVVAVIYCSGAIWTIPSIATSIYHVSYLKLLAVAAACVAGLFEEAFFRGYLMTALKDRGIGPTIQVIASGVLFGLLHAGWGLGGRYSLRGFVAPIVWTMVLGLALACVYMQGGRKLGPVILSHTAIDVVLEPGLLLSALRT